MCEGGGGGGQISREGGARLYERDVQVVQPEGVPRLEAIATEPVANEAIAAGPRRRRCHRCTRDICRDPPPSPSLISTFTSCV